MTRHDLMLAENAALVQRLVELHPPVKIASTERIERLLADLGGPEKQLPPVIHVAGTNGKGSTTAFLRSIAESAGLRVHVLTSPHLVRFAERIRVAGELVSPECLSELIERAEAANAGRPIGYAEMSTAIGFLGFSEVEADLCIVEVGLGGRFDSTNVIVDSAVSVITPVDYDHVEILGPELSDIAREKAGIIKYGRPCVVASQADEARAVIESEARALQAPLILMGRDAVSAERDGHLLVRVGDYEFDLPSPGLFGPHQYENAALAVVAILQLNHPGIDKSAIARGVASAVWPGRFQELTKGHLGRRVAAAGARVFLDGGHNPHAGRALASSIERLLSHDDRPVVLVVGMYARKDTRGFFESFRSLHLRVFTVGFDGPAVALPSDLALAAGAAGLEAQPKNSVEIAIEDAIKQSDSPPHIIICGGLHFAGEVLAQDPELWPT
jgi:dihydrofolate synthase/folylpolyglutamate synthase